ncbi:DUF4476 domain-containing protein [Mucilaginibacter sp. ZT4R22]|uniref:DUF4476 domain-containing protein n=1 Tax=Mucilaginibacter pankratovii TaxID=2772110 RepID=A0ABR7WQX6_9SPHI|nr:DUF4476 domain-containing protein [Mucilaginibacter pankratovii]MBD1364724.1 DUF4476 domain-containing protein [Mucilaginibacter pankratovii]
MKKLFCIVALLLSVSTLAFSQKIQHPKQAMTDAQAKAILADMQQKGSDAEKVEALKAGVKDKGITVEQLMLLLNQFSADEGKLTCAKFAFAYTVNYKKYDKIQDLFGDEASKRELEDFVKKNK